MNEELFSHDTKLERESPAKAAKFSILVPSPSISSFRVTAPKIAWWLGERGFKMGRETPATQATPKISFFGHFHFQFSFAAGHCKRRINEAEMQAS